MDETDDIAFRRSIYLFILQINTVNQVHKCITKLLNYYISNQLDHSLSYLFDNGYPKSTVKAI